MVINLEVKREGLESTDKFKVLFQQRADSSAKGLLHAKEKEAFSSIQIDAICRMLQVSVANEYPKSNIIILPSHCWDSIMAKNGIYDQHWRKSLSLARLQVYYPHMEDLNAISYILFVGYQDPFHWVSYGFLPNAGGPGKSRLHIMDSHFHLLHPDVKESVPRIIGEKFCRFTALHFANFDCGGQGAILEVRSRVFLRSLQFCMLAPPPPPPFLCV